MLISKGLEEVQMWPIRQQNTSDYHQGRNPWTPKFCSFLLIWPKTERSLFRIRMFFIIINIIII